MAALQPYLHLCKIDLADEIFVVDRDNYIGDSTCRGISYAEKTGSGSGISQEILRPGPKTSRY